MSQAAFRLEILDGDRAAHLRPARQQGQHARPGRARRADSCRRRPRQAAPTCRASVSRSGKPGMFIAGADLKELGAAQPTAGTNGRLVQHGLDIIAAFEALPYPTRRAHRRRLHGRRAGAGHGLRLPHRRHAPQDGARPARDEDRPHPRLGRHAAADRGSSARPSPPR